MDEQIPQLSILHWIFHNNIKNEKGEPLDFSDRLFLLDILTDWSQDIVWKKCTQIGGSLIFNLKVIFAVEVFKWNAIYTFPTDSDVEEFVKSKTNQLIKHNPHVLSGLSQDSIYLKDIHGRFIFFKGTISKTAAIMTSADLLAHDEADRSDQKVIGQYTGRLKASAYKRRWIFSNPTNDGGVIDQAWQKSDQREWMHTCTGCGLEQAFTWPTSVDIERKALICIGCKKEMTREERRVGRWVVGNPNSAIHGYHVSHLDCAWIPVEEIIAESEGDQENFFNFTLGEPYTPGDLKVTKSTILDCWTPKSLETGNWYLGVDVGNIKHYVLGSEKGVTKVGKFTEWNDLDVMMQFYDPVLVIDAMPDNTMARYYVEKYRRALMSFFGQNQNNPNAVIWYGENDRKGIVYSERDRVLDQLIWHIIQAKMLFSMSSDKDFREYIKHWETLKRNKVVNNRGIERYIWESTTGEDHYAFATLYYYLATLSKGSGVFIGEATEDNRTPLITYSTKEGHKINLKEWFDQEGTFNRE